MESISAQVMDLHTDVADLDAKECFLDRMIEGCRTELKNLTEDSEVAKYPFWQSWPSFIDYSYHL